VVRGIDEAQPPKDTEDVVVAIVLHSDRVFVKRMNADNTFRVGLLRGGHHARVLPISGQ